MIDAVIVGRSNVMYMAAGGSGGSSGGNLGGGSGGNNGGDDDGGEGGVKLSDDMVLEIYVIMYPEDTGFMHINKSRVKTIAEFINGLGGGWPAMITNKTRQGLLIRGYLPSQIDAMSPMQANARLYRLEHDKNVSGPLQNE